MKLLAVDTETTGLDFFHGCRPFMVTAHDGEYDYIWEGKVDPYTRRVSWDDNELDDIQITINSAERLVFHNANFDIRMLSGIGINIRNIHSKTDDTVIMSHCLRSGGADTKTKKFPGRTRGLKDMALEFLDYPDDDETNLQNAVINAVAEGKSKGYDVARYGHPFFPGAKKQTQWYKMDYWLALNECRFYAKHDARRTYLLHHCFQNGLIQEGLYEIYETRRQLLEICYEMTSNGLYFYKSKAKEYLLELDETIEKLRQAIRHKARILYRFEPTKPDHLVDLLHNKLNIPIVFRTDTGKPSVNKDALKYYEEEYKDHKAIKLLTKIRRISTIMRYLNSYIKYTTDNDTIHASINVTGTRETRQSTSDPNIQNLIPDLKRRFFGPRPGYIWVSFDLKNIELCLWAYSVGSKDLIGCFERGESVHILIFKTVYADIVANFDVLYPKLYEKYGLEEGIKNLSEAGSETYKDCKAGTFSIVYGAGEDKTDRTYKRKGSQRKVIERFPEVGQFIADCHAEVFRNAELINQPCIHTMDGYRLDVPPSEPHSACNYKIQGAAGRLMNFIMIRCYELMKKYPQYQLKMISQVHDELTFECPMEFENQVVELLHDNIEAAGGKKFPPYRAEYKVKHHPHDK